MTTPGLGPATPSTGKRQLTRDRMLDTALQLFSEHGYLGVRVEDIATRSGVSRATFYKHFSEREQILAELFERLLGTASEEPPDSGPVAQQVVAAVEGAVARMLEQEQLARFVYSLPVRHSALLRPGVRATPYVFEQVTRLLEQGARTGEIRTDVPVPLLARHVLATLETAMRDWAEGAVDEPLSRVGLMLALSLDGVVAH
ncbi:MAG: TetR/AcrR family transcriptional regulator [Candidatus Nanopelagicales bacterium]